MSVAFDKHPSILSDCLQSCQCTDAFYLLKWTMQENSRSYLSTKYVFILIMN